MVLINPLGEEGEVDSDEDPDYKPIDINDDIDITKIPYTEDDGIYEDRGNIGDIIGITTMVLC